MTQHWSKATWRGKGLFGLVVTGHHQKKPRRQLKAGIWCRGHGGMLLTGLFSMACSTCFIIQPKGIHVYSFLDLPTSINLENDRPHMPIWWRGVPGNAGLYQVNKNEPAQSLKVGSGVSFLYKEDVISTHRYWFAEFGLKPGLCTCQANALPPNYIFCVTNL